MKPDLKYKDEIDRELDKMQDQLYKETREAINQGKRVPYREYVAERSIYWLASVANSEDLAKAQAVIAKRQQATSVS